jgi:sporulation protein YlmC with PRC-barrel domain
MKTLLLSAALAAIVSAPAFAQQQQPGEITQPGVNNEFGQRMMDLMHEYGYGSSAGFTLDQGYVAGDGNFIASDLMGAPVHTTASADAEVIGDINNFVLSESGQIDAVVIGVGGFLGMGEKEVAVPFSNLSFWYDENGDRHIVLETTREALDAAPAFVWEEPAPTTATVDQPTTLPAPADPMAPAADQQMADAQQPMTQEGVSPDTLQTVDVATLTAEELIGTEVAGPNNENIGVVGDVALTAEGQVDALIVDVGGFLGIGAKPVAVGFDNLDIRADANGDLFVWIQATREQLETLPAYDPNLYATERDNMRLGSLN